MTDSEIARLLAIETNIAALKVLLDERDKRYKQRAVAQDIAVQIAVQNSEKAIAKAELATEKRFDSVNEFRATLSDQANTLMPRAEYAVQHGALSDKIEAAEGRISELQKDISTIQARGGGLKDAWGYLIGGAGVILAGIAIYFHGH